MIRILRPPGPQQTRRALRFNAEGFEVIVRSAASKSRVEPVKAGRQRSSQVKRESDFLRLA